MVRKIHNHHIGRVLSDPPIMIVRDEGDTLLLITQPDHARLAEQLVAAFRSEPALDAASRDVILLATREHDNGWAEVDAEPMVDVTTGRPVDFTSGPPAVKHELWRRGITRAAKTDRRAGALVAEHALSVYSYRHADPDWRSFFDSITAIRDDLLGQLGLLTGPPRRLFEAQYRCVRLGDSFSLHFCNAWIDTRETLGYRSTCDGRRLQIAPDPFGGVRVPLRVLGRRIAARHYDSDADLREALAAVAPEVVTGEAVGV